jgi:Methylase involved in ubiquinone/menaquinone biosynthesis|tara:strand:- start:126 stop:941 length:816 start_codon:yes stop_codon:yes gene_type:complete
MKNFSKKSKIDAHGLCLNEYENNFNNAKVYFDRATGKKPEMEVSKAIANLIKKKIKNNDSILDVGCACGHYYRSIKKRVNKNFFYTGTDPYQIFLNKAKIAWKNEPNVNFIKGNIYNLPFKKSKFEISICSNVFIHLNKIKKPLEELIRVTKKTIIIRTVVYDVSYKIQLVYNKKWWKNTNVKPKDEFDKNGNPRAYSYFNILSKDFLKETIKSIDKRAKVKFVKDIFFNKKKINKSIKNEKRPLATRIIGSEQFSGCLMQPHYYVIIEKN